MYNVNNIFEGVHAVLFDMDGTLVETDIDFPLMKREMVALGVKYGLRSSELEGLDILAVVDLTVARLEEQSRAEDARRARQEAFEKLEQIELAPCQDARPVDGAIELLSALREAGIKIGIVTRNCRTGVGISSERTGVYADVLLTRDDVLNTKPHPDHLLQALDALGASPSQAMMVGDHWMDIQAGKAAGTRTVGFLRPDRQRDFFDKVQPDMVICDLGELLDQFRRLNM